MHKLFFAYRFKCISFLLLKHSKKSWLSESVLSFESGYLEKKKSNKILWYWNFNLKAFLNVLVVHSRKIHWSPNLGLGSECPKRKTSCYDYSLTLMHKLSFIYVFSKCISLLLQENWPDLFQHSSEQKFFFKFYVFGKYLV